ncbi:MAG: AHH domain-containing protein [Verrucomicrobia bacterium]|nr:AHH domain-containing protein [Verrucomicrobiota bacterium]
MAEIGEGVAIGVIDDRHDEECPYCKCAKEKPEKIENDLVADIDEDAPGFDGPLGNNSGKLGTACKDDKPSPQTIDDVPVALAAHHLIPGNAALGESALKSGNHLWKHGMEHGNIGYNINSAANGVWLPGSYALHKTNVTKRNATTDRNAPSWKEQSLPERQEYAVLATLLYGAQFHDSHKDYNEFVRRVLDKIAAKLEYAKGLNCPEATTSGEKPPGERPPLKVIVSRLNKLSKRMKGMLTRPDPVRWRKNIYTSDKYGPTCLNRACGAPVTHDADADQLVKEIGFL